MTSRHPSGPSLLVVDDDSGVVEFLSEMLVERGYRAHGLTSGLAAIQAAQQEFFDLIISDVEMPEQRGIDLVSALQRIPSSPPVLLMTAFGTIDLAVQAVRAGACDFLTKPFAIEVLYEAVERALRERQVRREVVRLRTVRSSNAAADAPLAESTAMRRVLDLAERIARSESTVLLSGETGTGKTTVARHIHSRSTRKTGPFISVNCAALPSTLIEAELFGVRRGAFTDAQHNRDGLLQAAHHGTLFLDEISELPLEAQAKLLHALEFHSIRPVGSTDSLPVDTRILAASNQPLEQRVRDGRFRADLFYRLNVIRLEIPPLRQRREDIPALVDRFLAETCLRAGRDLIGITAAALHKLQAHAFPGNVRELFNIIERAVVLTEHSALIPEDLDLSSEGSLTRFLHDASRENLPLAELERAYVQHVLREHHGNKAAAARALSIDRGTLYRKL